MNAYPALPAFAMALAALFLKTTLTSTLQVLARFRSRRFVLPEDAALVGVRTQSAESAFVQRCAGVWRNDVENLPLFFALALTYVLLGGDAQSARLLFATYVTLRYAHTVMYLRGVQPWRAVCYLAGMLVSWVLAVRIVVLVMSETTLLQG